MPRGLNNWTFQDVVDFLKSHDFYLSECGVGSHYVYYISPDKKYEVDINRITKSESYPIRTLETMIQNSGIPKKEWRKWAKNKR